MKALVIAVCLMGQPALADCLILGDFALAVEEDVGLIERADGVTVVFAPGGRAPSDLALTFLTAPPEGADLPETEVLRNGLTLRYATEVAEAGGSGGAETLLTGWLDSSPPMGVACSGQAEVPDADWCVPVLGALRPRAEGCGAGGN
jgi:hypothetical protein